MKQRMFRVRSYLENDTLTTTDSNVVLFSASNSCTIRRIIGYIAVKSGNGVSPVVNGTIEIAPNGQVTNSAFSSTALDSSVNENYMGGFIVTAGRTGTSTEARTDMITWESKGMRKLRANDDLVLSHSSTSTTGTLSAYFDIFISE